MAPTSDESAYDFQLHCGLKYHALERNCAWTFDLFSILNNLQNLSDFWSALHWNSGWFLPMPPSQPLKMLNGSFELQLQVIAVVLRESVVGELLSCSDQDTRHINHIDS